MGRLDAGGLGGEQEASIRFGDDASPVTPVVAQPESVQGTTPEQKKKERYIPPDWVNPNIQYGKPE